MKPRILLTARPSADAAPIHESRYREWVFASDTDSLRDAGAIVTIIPISDPHDIPIILEAVDGLVIAGGRDINPHCYGQEPESHTGAPHDGLDASDLALLRNAKLMGIPTLGICRGAQALNVMLGGNLTQHITDDREDHPPLPETFEERIHHRHKVTLEEGSWIADVFGRTEIETNSIHHQAIDVVGQDLEVVGRADDGTIEAVESTTDWFALGVQWHPELLSHPESLFDPFVDLVEQHRQGHDRRAVRPTA